MSKIDRLVGQVVASGALAKAERAKKRDEAAAARRKLKRAEREKLRIAAAAEIWDDREGKARPTPQRRLKGVFSLRDADEAGVSVAVDSASCVIDALAERGVITARQCEAGHIFEAAARGALGSPAGRSCVDFSPVGHDGDGDDEETVRANKRWSSLRRMIRPDDRREMMAVCWQNAKPQRLEQLRRGLDATADWAGLEPERKI
ncbi:hypothetical protein [Paracoccus sp. AS002]|uniref:hypothetical protein n=1 Tax=Paracoccus sp. AS002 TaxID=3019545 RepID=UPI0023E8EB98|nr:hypothetical protein [Paracoccus sp. AS002]MDF3904684.1 hypothetical protein [Paracoccus sp. AS002]